VSELGDLLERLYGARNRWRTVRATVHQWTDAARTHEAWARHAAEARRAGAGVVASARGHGGAPVAGLVAASVERVWIDGPGRRSRVEQEDRLRVRDGDTWWHYDAVHGAMSNEEEPQVGSGGHGLEDLLDPAPLVGTHDLDLGAAIDVGGRAGRRVTVTPRPFPDDRYQMIGGAGRIATEVEWAVDDERGVLLRVTSRLDGQPYHVKELRDLAFDAPIDDQVFDFVPPPGEVVRSPSQRFAPAERPSIEEIAARAPFTVLVPGRLPEAATWTRSSIPGGTGRPPLHGPTSRSAPTTACTGCPCTRPPNPSRTGSRGRRNRGWRSARRAARPS